MGRDKIERCVIVGASVAGANAADALRRQGFDGQVVLIGAEGWLPYERPPLSKELLKGEKKPADISLRPKAHWEKQRVEMRLGMRAERLRVRDRLVELDTGEKVRWDRLLIATGARPRKLQIPGAELKGVHYLRTADDAEAIAQAMPTVQHAVVIGGGFIGMEVA